MLQESREPVQHCLHAMKSPAIDFGASAEAKAELEGWICDPWHGQCGEFLPEAEHEELGS